MWCRTPSILISLLVIAISGNFALAACPSADLTGDCFVDFNDFAMMAAQWPATDFNDVAVMANQWLLEGVPIDPCNLVWVYIDDPGVPGHEGFTGYMSKYETTNAQYCEFLNAAKSDGMIRVYYSSVYAVSDTSHSQIYCKLCRRSSSSSQITYSGGVFSVRSRDGYDMAHHPVVAVGWYGATAFCNYYGYRLPTEWEWQAVADYDGSYTYGCGTIINQSNANYYDSGHCNPLNLSSYPYTSPVDYYSSYGYGMNDMAGNVWELTSSCYYAGCDYSYRVLRGGGWTGSDSNCTVSDRSHYYPTYTSGPYGFRVCR